MTPLLLAFYGDDFTGSADAMEALTVSGVKTALFLGHPTEERLKARPSNLQAVGISGTSRTMTPSQMDDELPGQLALLNGLEPRLIHYKVCATFDSSPEIGSIGHAADIAFDHQAVLWSHRPGDTRTRSLYRVRQSFHGIR